VLMTGVQDHAEAVTVQQLAEPTCVLEDAGEARRLEQVDLSHQTHRNPGWVASTPVVRCGYGPGVF